MSKFQATDEAIATLWDSLSRELDALAPSQAAADRLLKAARHDFLRMLRDFPEDVFDCVVTPAPGASSGILRFRINRRIYGHFALAAKRFYRSSLH